MLTGVLRPNPGLQGWLTVAAHLSGDRLASLTQLCHYWDGKITAAVFDGTADRVRAWCAKDRYVTFS